MAIGNSFDDWILNFTIKVEEFLKSANIRQKLTVFT